MLLPDESRYATSYYVKTDVTGTVSSASSLEKLQNWNNMATHELHHKIDEVAKLLRSIEDTTKRAKALLDQTTVKKSKREVKKFSLSEALKE